MSKTLSCIFCQKPARSRGLCQTHFAQFNRAKTKLDPDEAAEFDAASVKAGLIHPIAIRQTSNPFAELAEQLANRRKQDAKDEAAIAANEQRLAEIRKASSSDQDQTAVPIAPPAKNTRRTPRRK